MKLELFRDQQWIKNWSGNWSVLSCSYFGEQYTKTIAKNVSVSLHHVLFVFNIERNFCYFQADDLRRFGSKLGVIAERDKNFAQRLAKGLMRETSRFLKFVKRNSMKPITEEIYKEFQDIHNSYIQFHVPLKNLANFLPAKLLDKYFPILEKARVFAEPVYKHYEDFQKKFDRQLSRELGYPSNSVRTLTKQELLGYWAGKTLPSAKRLQARYKSSAMYFFNGKSEIITGLKVRQILKAIEKSYRPREILKGMTAYPGIVRGKVRIIFDPRKAEFKTGDILVTGMTRPEYLSIMRKAGGFITDAGGMLSHAAIMAREMRKPCIVGTEVATKFLKDGQMVELDANKGIIKVLK